MNGQEKDDEIVGSGNSYDFGERTYDPRLGRWLSIDPLSAKFPYYSPYSAFANNPVWYVDNDGKENIVYLVYLPNKDNKITKQDASDMAAKANENYKKMGLNTRVVMVDKSITGGKEFNASKIDKTDAVAVIGTVGDVTKYVTKQGGGDYLKGWSGGSEPERSQNEKQFDENGDVKSYGGGKFIAIDANVVNDYAAANGWTQAEAGGQIINHGSGHNADADLKLGHNERGVMMDAGDRQWSADKSDKNYPTITSPGRNKNFSDHVKKRFGTKEATINYNGKGTVVK
jgi:RHS repeat-associated protein